MEVSLGARWVAVDVCDVPVGATVASVRATVPMGSVVVVGQAEERGAVPVQQAGAGGRCRCRRMSRLQQQPRAQCSTAVRRQCGGNATRALLCRFARLCGWLLL